MKLSVSLDPELQREYEAAWQEWEESEDAVLWDSVASDGLGDG